MKNFKEIAEKCLAGELSGTFIIRNHTPLHSKYLYRYKIGRDVIYGYYELGGIVFNEKGEDIPHKDRIQNFIPDNMPEQIKIDIPEGKVPVMEQTENGVVITWKEKELTYDYIVNEFINNSKFIRNYTRDTYVDNPSSQLFYKKVDVLRKLTNIRNYFGKPNSYDRGYCVSHSSSTNTFYVGNVNTIGILPKDIIFAKQEHVEQAIKMLGDELKYLFEPW